MDDKARKAEELLEERLRTRTNGPSHGAVADPEPEAPATDPKVEELTNDLKRMTADFANYRKRNESERNEFAKFAKADLITKLLDVLDGYDRALASVPEDLKGQPGNNWVEGMWLVERKLRQILEGEGLVPVDSLGKPFDPYVHEAVAHVESDEPVGTVTQEHQKAYRLHDRVIRPALVSVAKA